MWSVSGGRWKVGVVPGRKGTLEGGGCCQAGRGYVYFGSGLYSSGSLFSLIALSSRRNARKKWQDNGWVAF